MFGLDAEVIVSAGLILVALIVFAESGLLVGFFLPGDTLLIAVGVLAAAPDAPFSIEMAILVIAIAAIVGDNVGYYIGRLSGKRLFHKKDGILFRQEYIEKAETFYEKHGGKTIILARFIPIVRTFAPMVAGIGHMNRTKFFLYNVVGGILWATSVTLIGYWVGSKIPGIGKYMEYAVIGVMFIALIPAVWHIAKDPKARHMIALKFKKIFRRQKTENTESPE